MNKWLETGIKNELKCSNCGNTKLFDIESVLGMWVDEELESEIGLFDSYAFCKKCKLPAVLKVTSTYVEDDVEIEFNEI